MITEITDSNYTLRLRPNAGDRENIFDIDSLSLLIGPNGSGKTQFLRKILDTMRNPSVDAFATEVSVITDLHQLPADKRELMEWGTIFYSPLPWRERFRSTSRVVDASPHYPRKMDIERVMEYDHLLKSLHISPQAQSTLEADLGSVLRLMVSKYVKKDVNVWKGWISRSDVVAYRSSLERLNSSKHSRIDDMERTSVSQKSLNQLSEDSEQLLRACTVQLYDSLLRMHDKLLVNAVLTVMHGMQKYNRLNTNLAPVIFLDFFGIDIPHRASPNVHETLVDVVTEISTIKKLFNYHDADVSSDLIITFRMDFKKWKLFFREEKKPKLTLFEHHLIAMSSGEMAVILQLISLDDAVQKITAIKKRDHLLIMIDEGDAFLHLEWQRNYIWLLNKALSQIKTHYNLHTLQLILTTHSPLLATDVPKDFICRLTGHERSVGRLVGNRQSEKAASLLINGFASPMPELFKSSFGTKTIGEFAAEKINQLYSNILKGKTLITNDFYLIENLDNRLLKAEIERVLLEREGDDADFNR